jgi:hypothetical protein
MRATKEEKESSQIKEIKNKFTEHGQWTTVTATTQLESNRELIRTEEIMTTKE